ncbi:hypothetical protein TWF730_009392 [Orbilia blumenaviensis]|uniref:Uncharacterized protein n=1 Tax=Orbilia blumenaviensis TaxID=1796055 RepID=A0AAV9UZQ6_9PEZI
MVTPLMTQLPSAPYEPCPVSSGNWTPECGASLLERHQRDQVPFSGLFGEAFSRAYEKLLEGIAERRPIAPNTQEDLAYLIGKSKRASEKLAEGWEGSPQFQGCSWALRLHAFKWLCEHRHDLLADAHKGESTTSDEPLLLPDRLSFADMTDALWRSRTEWPLHSSDDGLFAFDGSVRARIEGSFELMVDEPLKTKIWEGVRCGSPWPVRGPQKRARSSGDEEDSPPPTRKRARQSTPFHLI